MRLGVLGINFKTADLTLREAIAKGASVFDGEKAIFFPHPNVLLSTCNRTEIYFSAHDLAQAHSDLLSFLRKTIQEEFEHRLYSYFGFDCFAHLCRVTAGIDSAIFAETEIQRQVKVAYTKANTRELSSCLHYAFQKALKIGKLVRSTVSIERGNLYTTLWHLTKWHQKKILLVGNSEINRGLISFLQHKGVFQLDLCTQNPSHVRLEGVRPFDRAILKQWPSYDIVVCASKAEEYLIKGEGESIIFDLSVPRNVDPDVARRATLYNMEQINQMQKVQRSEEAEALVLENALRLHRLYRIKTRRDLVLLGMGSHL